MSLSTDANDDARSARQRRLMVAAYVAAQRDGEWPELDTGLLDDRRAAVPAFPVELLPSPWREWIADTARSIGTAPDYVAQAVLAALAGLCGAGVAVRITPAWSEPLVLWQALIGPSAGGKSRALAPVRRTLAALDEERRAGADAAKASSVVAGEDAAETLAAAVAANPHGILLWRDEPSAAFAGLGGWRNAWAAGDVAFKRPHGPPLRVAQAPVSVVTTVLPDGLNETLAADDGLAARFLYAWPQPPSWCPLTERKPLRDDDALAMLRRVARGVRTPKDPLELTVDEHGQKALDGFLAGLHAEAGRVEGLEACWLGNGPGTVARLAGALELLGWSGLVSAGRPGAIGRDHVETAAALWTSYFRPHARAVFQQAAPSNFTAQVRRAARWLKAAGKTVVSREDIRRDALSQSINAHEAEMVIGRLAVAGMLRLIDAESSPHRGPRTRRWQVNPALAEMG